VFPVVLSLALGVDRLLDVWVAVLVSLDWDPFALGLGLDRGARGLGGLLGERLDGLWLPCRLAVSLLLDRLFDVRVPIVGWFELGWVVFELRRLLT
jgi:hypothetical protein